MSLRLSTVSQRDWMLSVHMLIALAPEINDRKRDRLDLDDLVRPTAQEELENVKTASMPAPVPFPTKRAFMRVTAAAVRITTPYCARGSLWQQSSREKSVQARYEATMSLW